MTDPTAQDIAECEALFDATQPWALTSADRPFAAWLPIVQAGFLEIVRRRR